MESQDPLLRPVSSKTEIASSETTNGTERGAGKVPGTRAIPGHAEAGPTWQVHLGKGKMPC
ncbi:hypothetical protein [Sphingobacterium mizutaii]|uniref:hypothetical protein n=1 Tax=Sphingobacterium mizutaii TaxID=1010 RepID=UPI0016249CBA|nr:hypothetical protein [Sphingobacterium mizutaii]